MLFEVGERCHPIFQLPFPIVPELHGDPALARPIARRVREELFSIHFARGKSDHFLFCEAKCSCPYNRVNAGTLRCATPTAARLLPIEQLLYNSCPSSKPCAPSSRFSLL